MQILTKEEIIKKLKFRYTHNRKFAHIIFGFMAFVWLACGIGIIPYALTQEGEMSLIIVGIIAVVLGSLVLRLLIKSIKETKMSLLKIQNEQFYIIENVLVDVDVSNYDDGYIWTYKFDNGIEVNKSQSLNGKVGDEFYFVYLEGDKTPLYYNKKYYALSTDLQGRIIFHKAI